MWGCLFVGAFKFYLDVCKLTLQGKVWPFVLLGHPTHLHWMVLTRTPKLWFMQRLIWVKFFSIKWPLDCYTITQTNHTPTWPTLGPNRHILAQNTLFWPFGGPFTFRPLCSFCGLSLPLPLSAGRLSLWTLKKSITNMQCSLGNNWTQQCLHFDVYPCPWPSLF